MPSIAGRTSSGAILALAVTSLAACAGTADACAVCYGAPDSPQIKAMQAGILVLLGCIGTVLAAFAGLFCYWLYRTQRLAAASGDTAN
jgi:hypothetical protein